jgi:hypothetical protein
VAFHRLHATVDARPSRVAFPPSMPAMRPIIPLNSTGFLVE